MPTLEMLPDQMPGMGKRLLPAGLQCAAETAPEKIIAGMNYFG
jgi:hypothetical protein